MPPKRQRTTFANDSCMVCLTSFDDLIESSKITFAECQHTMCLPCVTKHMGGGTDVSNLTPCCKQPIHFSIHSQDREESPIYKFYVANTGTRLFRAQTNQGRFGHGIRLTSLNENMLLFNEIAEDREEDGRHDVAVSTEWKQIYFQLPGHEEVDGTTTHLVIVRVKDNQLEFAWEDLNVSIGRLDLPCSVRLPL
jgi:hypothetical protein